MIHRAVLAATAAAAIALGSFAWASVSAHQGHTHKFMGTITMVHPMEKEHHVMIKLQDGKNLTVTVNQDTEIFKGKTKAPVSDLKEGVRVVIEAGSDEAPIVAKVVRLGEGEATSAS